MCLFLNAVYWTLVSNLIYFELSFILINQEPFTCSKDKESGTQTRPKCVRTRAAYFMDVVKQRNIQNMIYHMT